MAASHVIHADDAGQRLDRYLRKLMPGATLAHVFKLIRKKRVRVNGVPARASLRLVESDVVDLDVAEATLCELTASRRRQPPRSHLPVDVLHRDADILAAAKPAGLAVHGGSGTEDDHLLARILAAVGIGAARTFRPAPAHRLDRLTSGVVLVGVSGRGLRELTRMLRERAIEKTYVAIVEGRPEPPAGSIDVSLARTDAARGPKVVAAAGGKSALTTYRTLGRSARHAFVRVELVTGRTHQIRAHFASIGCPIAGDRRYGGHGRTLCLHALEVRFRHPFTGRAMRIRAELPAAFSRMLRESGLEEVVP